MKPVVITTCLVVLVSALYATTPKITLAPNPTERKVDVLVDGKLFTSYIYPENIKKPVLWPVITARGNEITRQYPLKIKEGERIDHPHHVGIWFNYGDVNGLDFWNNSEAIPSGRGHKYGTIHHEKIEDLKDGDEKAVLKTSSLWKDSNGSVLLKEKTFFAFSVDGTTRIIDRRSMLTALTDKVDFTDNKEGMFAIRVTRELELPSKGKLKLTDSHGVVTEVNASKHDVATGNYLSSEGLEGSSVWATRAKWMKLYGEMNGERIAVVIYDHPENAGYPTYWHARGYGLFSANTLGQKVFSKGKEEMNFSLLKGESAIFKYRVAIFSGEPSVEEIEKLSKDFEVVK